MEVLGGALSRGFLPHGLPAWSQGAGGVGEIEAARGPPNRGRSRLYPGGTSESPTSSPRRVGWHIGMADQLQTIQSLKKLGLTEYEARTYISLLELGATTADNISKKSEVPISRVYSVLGDLEKKGFLQSTPGRPVKYRPVEPGMALETLMTAKVKELEQARTNILSYLEGLFGQNLQRGAVEFWYATDEGSIARRLHQALTKSKERVTVALAPHPMLNSTDISDAILTNIRTLTKRRIRVTLVGSPKNLRNFLQRMKSEEGIDTVERDVREGFIIVDDSEAVWITANPKGAPLRAYIFNAPLMVELATRMAGHTEDSGGTPPRKDH